MPLTAGAGPKGFFGRLKSTRNRRASLHLPAASAALQSIMTPAFPVRVVRPWMVAAGLVLLVASGIGIVTALGMAPACVPHGPQRLVGREASLDRACAIAEEETASAVVLAGLGVL